MHAILLLHVYACSKVRLPQSHHACNRHVVQSRSKIALALAFLEKSDWSIQILHYCLNLLIFNNPIKTTRIFARCTACSKCQLIRFRSKFCIALLRWATATDFLVLQPERGVPFSYDLANQLYFLVLDPAQRGGGPWNPRNHPKSATESPNSHVIVVLYCLGLSLVTTPLSISTGILSHSLSRHTLELVEGKTVVCSIVCTLRKKY